MEETYEISLDEKYLFIFLLNKECIRLEDNIKEFSKKIYTNDKIAQEVLKNNKDTLKAYQKLINRLDNL